MRRVFLLTVLIECALASSAEAPRWPLWDGHESIAEYAKRANLQPTKNIDLGNGMQLETVLIPAGEFIMGTPEPEPVDVTSFNKQIFIAQALMAISGGVLLVLLSLVIINAIQKHHRPQFSLSRLLAMVIVAGVILLSGLHRWQLTQTLANLNAEFHAAVMRYKALTDGKEKPAHKVELTTPFYIAKYELTQEQYEQIMGENPSFVKGSRNPVERVCWDDAQEFCKKANLLVPLMVASQIVRLPTEAEWEYACRAGTKTAYYSGDIEEKLDDVSWYKNDSKGVPHSVGEKPPNAWGLYDMHGNVSEWCKDWYEEAYSAAIDPQGPLDGMTRVLRGGSWTDSFKYCRSAYRGERPPSFISRSKDIGFRIAITARR